jgi:hypothetical protein
MVVPSGGSNDDAFVGANAGLSVGDDGRRSGEVDGNVNRGEKLGSKRAGLGVFREVEDLHVMTAFFRHFGYQGAGLSAA